MTLASLTRETQRATIDTIINQGLKVSTPTLTKNRNTVRVSPNNFSHKIPPIVHEATHHKVTHNFSTEAPLTLGNPEGCQHATHHWAEGDIGIHMEKTQQEEKGRFLGPSTEEEWPLYRPPWLPIRPNWLSIPQVYHYRWTKELNYLVNVKTSTLSPFASRDPISKWSS